MSEIELSTGIIDYTDTDTDTRGDGPVIVLLQGQLMDASLWDDVIAGLPGYRCVAPTLPLGAHRRAMKPDADLSLPGIARLATEFFDRLGLEDVTLVGNDTGGAITQVLIADGAPRVGRMMLVSCEAFGNFPPAADRQDARSRRETLARFVRAGHAADAAPAAAAAPECVRMADQTR
jgi:pimeloyl-ACP methyl ester carboxylesterase